MLVFCTNNNIFLRNLNELHCTSWSFVCSPIKIRKHVIFHCYIGLMGFIKSILVFITIMINLIVSFLICVISIPTIFIKIVLQIWSLDSSITYLSQNLKHLFLIIEPIVVGRIIFHKSIKRFLFQWFLI